MFSWVPALYIFSLVPTTFFRSQWDAVSISFFHARVSLPLTSQSNFDHSVL